MSDSDMLDPQSASRKNRGFVSSSMLVFGRNISYIDAVYGFAATLLISNVDPPSADDWRSVDSLLASGVVGQVLGFVLSFTVIAVFWRLNVRLVDLFTGLDAVTTVLNLVAAGSVILLAFTTQGISDPSSVGLPLPTVVYALNVALVSLVQTAMYEVARARGLLKDPTTRRQNAADIIGGLVTPVVFLASVPVTLVWGAFAGRNVWVALVVLAPLAGILSARYAASPTRKHPDS